MTSLFAPRAMPIIMGIVNVTPDSFSDGGSFLAPARAVSHGLYLREQGADIIDVGGESTRPGAAAVSVEEELARVLPVVQGLVATGAIVSVDTRQLTVMEAALAAGAHIINDISATTQAPECIDLIARYQAHVVLMHMQGQPQSMQDAPHYTDVVTEVADFLLQRAEACQAGGIPKERIALDPGIGFGKSVQHNLSLLKHFDRLVAHGYPTLLGVSRKSFIAKLSKNESPQHRLAGGLAATLWTMQQATMTQTAQPQAAPQHTARILRVHDVAETVQALKIWHAIHQADSPASA